MMIRPVLLILATIGVAAPAMAQGGGRPTPDGYVFYWPGACVEAMRRSNAFHHREYPDTSQFSPGTDTLIDETKRAVRECLVELDPSYVPSFHAVTLAQLYAANGNLDSARRIIERRLAEPDARSAGAKSWILQQVVASLLARPARLDEAKRYLTQLNAIPGDSALPGRLIASDQMAGYYRRRSDGPEMVRQSRETLEIAKAMPNSEQREFVRYIVMAYRILLEEATVRSGDSVEIAAILDEARNGLANIPNGQPPLNLLVRLYGLIGKPAAPLYADMWVAGDSVYPKPGVVTLISFGSQRNNIPMLRRLASSYGDQLEIASVMNTSGFFAGKGPLTPEFEAQDIRDHFVDSLGLPGSLGIVATQFNTIPDGRRQPNPDPNSKAYNRQSRVMFVLVDTTGKIRAVWQLWTRQIEAEIRAVVEASTNSPG